MDRELQEKGEGIIFFGKIDKSKRTWIYEVGVIGLSEDCMRNYCHLDMIYEDDNFIGLSDEAILCAGAAKYVLGMGNKYSETMAWGYNGIGPQLLAGMLLAAAQNRVERSYTAIGAFGFLERGAIMTLARQHCKAFTKEIISKLPDSWTMSAADILTWIDKQKQPTTPRVEHEREEKTK